MNYTQKRIVKNNGNICVTSVPGSGKTYTLVERFADLIKTKRAKQENILILTFTNDAVNEIIERSQFINYNKEFSVMTIDKFAVMINKKYNSGYTVNLKFHIYDAITLIKKNNTLKEYFLKKYKYIMIDEFQDTSMEQYELLHSVFYPHYNFMVIGDPNQSIYGWRGSKGNKIFEIFKTHYKPKEFIMTTNYRSSFPIIELAKTLLGLNQEFMNMEPNVFTYLTKIKLIYYNDINIYTYIKNQINKYLELGFGYDDISILYRYGIDNKNISIIGLNKYLEFNNIPTFKNNLDTTDNISKIIDYIEDKIEKNNKIDYRDVEKHFRIRLTSLAKGMLRNSTKELFYLKYKNEIKKELVNSGRININTIHSSKGMEYPVVFLIHPYFIPELIMNELEYPELKNKDQAEEIRLSYVGITRAKYFLEIITNKKILEYSFSKTDTSVNEYLNI